MPKVLNYRNPHFISKQGGLVDLEINTAEYGWIPTSINMGDSDKQPHILQIKQWLTQNQNLIAPYVEHVATPSEVYESKVNYINNTRDVLLKDANGTVTTPDGLVWQVDPTSMQQLNDALTVFTVVGSTPEGFTWRDANNVNHPASLAFLAGIAGARAMQVQTIWTQSWNLKDQLKTAYEAGDIPAMEAITW